MPVTIMAAGFVTKWAEGRDSRLSEIGSNAD